ESGLELSPLDTSPATTSTTIPTSGSAVTTPGGTDTTIAVPTTTPAPMKWTETTLNLPRLHSHCGHVAIHTRPRPDLMIALVNTPGLDSMPAGGSEWTPIGTAGDPVNNRMTQILADPANPNTFWESGSYGHGVYRTDDNGTTFRALGDVEHVDYMSIDFTDPE